MLKYWRRGAATSRSGSREKHRGSSSSSLSSSWQRRRHPSSVVTASLDSCKQRGLSIQHPLLLIHSNQQVYRQPCLLLLVRSVCVPLSL